MSAELLTVVVFDDGESWEQVGPSAKVLLVTPEALAEARVTGKVPEFEREEDLTGILEDSLWRW